MSLFAGLEAGGTKFICGLGSGPQDLMTAEFPTTTPDETIGRCLEFFHGAESPISGIGIGCFGPIDRGRGAITTTPKPGWRGCDVANAFGRVLGVPVTFDTDVNAALTGEARWGAAVGIGDCVYLTVGTGIGGAAMLAGKLLYGTAHPEMGHMRVPRLAHDAGFPGVCPVHGDCLEGLASGPAIAAREGSDFEAEYLALGIANLACTLAPARVILGGGVMQQPGLLDLVRERMGALINGYVAVPELVPPMLGRHSGVLGALVMAGA